MLNLRTLSRLLIGNLPANSYLTLCNEDRLYDNGLTMGTLYIGGQGTGKTTALARHLIDYMRKHPNRAIFVLDWSGSITDSLLSIIMASNDSDTLLKRVIYDQLGNQEFVVPMPEFSPSYGGTYEDQIQRVVDNMRKLSPELVSNAPLLGGLAVSEIAPHFLRLLTSITNDGVDPNETWQITEAKQLLVDRNILKKLVTKYGSKIPETAWYLNREYLSPDVKSSERELRTFALRSLLNITDIREVKARLGYYHPGWTPKEAVETGKLVILDGGKLIDQKASQHYLFTQVFSLIMAEIKRRRPADPRDEPISIVLDEVASLIENPGISGELANLPSLYRSRKLQLYVVLQKLAQMSKELHPHIWSLGNVVCFAISNFDEAYEISQQLFRYEPLLERLPAEYDRQRPIMENDRGQALIIANWIQNLKKRECVMRRMISEQERDVFVRHVPQTLPVKLTDNYASLNELKDELLKKRAVRVHDALEQINRRHQQSESRPTAPPSVS